MKRLAGLTLAALTLFVGACGGGEESEESNLSGPLALVERSLGEVRSGRIDLALLASTPEGEPVGFEMKGPFAVAEGEDEIPVADLTYVRRVGPQSEESRFVADGEQAWVVTRGEVQEVSDKRLEGLRGGEDVAGLEGLHPTKWFDGEVTEEPGEAIDGVKTVSYSGDVDAVEVLNDIIGLAGNLGAEVPGRLEGEDAERVRNAVESAELTLLAGADDDIVRRIAYEVKLAVKGEELKEALGDLAGVVLQFDIDLTDVNDEIEPPRAPDGSQPADEGSAEPEADEPGSTDGESGGSGSGGTSRTSTTSDTDVTERPSSTTSTSARETTTTTAA